MLRRLLFQLAAMAVAIPAGLAQAPAPTGVIGADNRHPVAPDAAPWRAIGQINVAGLSRLNGCSGTLIAPDRVVTAAHCLFNPVTLRPFEARQVHFVAGRHNNDWLGHAIARCFSIADGFQYSRKPSHEGLSNDVAVIRLAKPLDIAPVAAIEGRQLKIGETVDHAGYGRDRRYQLSVHHGCRVIDTRGDLIATDCDSVPGQSGGPVLRGSGAEAQVAAILVAGFKGKASIGVTASRWRGLATGAACENSEAMP